MYGLEGCVGTYLETLVIFVEFYHTLVRVSMLTFDIDLLAPAFINIQAPL
jgi:hypothetical protein